jgi:putative nucleotidyltransferase with HDIG domain
MHEQWDHAADFHRRIPVSHPEELTRKSPVNYQTDLRTAIENISGLPTLPTVIDRITRLLQNPQTSAEEIGKAITVDQALASKVLKLVNSAFYGFPGKIGTITHSVVILGFSTVKNVVLTASIFDIFHRKGSPLGSFDIEQFWKHSIATGAASQAIAKHIGFEQKETCFIAGLLHDIGKLILCHHMPAEFARIVNNAAAKEILFYESERELFDLTHCEVGDILTRKWNLPPELQQSVLHHHNPSPSHNHYMVTAIVHAADIFVRALDYGNGGDNKIPVMSENVWRNLGLEHLPLQPLVETIGDEVEKAMIFLQI